MEQNLLVGRLFGRPAQSLVVVAPKNIPVLQVTLGALAMCVCLLPGATNFLFHPNQAA
jgi:hypothetical protein